MTRAIPPDLPWGYDGLVGQCHEPSGVPVDLRWGRFAALVAESHVVQSVVPSNRPVGRGIRSGRPVNGAASVAVVGRVSYWVVIWLKTAPFKWIQSLPFPRAAS